MELFSNKPIISWKYHKLKMYLIHLSYWTSKLSLVYLTRAQNTYVSLQLGKPSNTKLPFYNKVLSISCNLLNTMLKVKNRMFMLVLKVQFLLNRYCFCSIVKLNNYKSGIIHTWKQWLETLTDLPRYHLGVEREIWLTLLKGSGEKKRGKKPLLIMYAKNTAWC